MILRSLGEGHTPLVASVAAGPALGLERLYFKLENCNPSGSYKDRFISAEVARIAGMGARACVATSSGNTGASLAAYSARYGLRCGIVVDAATPAGKLEQMRAHGAIVFRVPGFLTSPDTGRQILDTLAGFSSRHGAPLVVSAYRYCPEGMAGVESLAAELRAQLAGGPDHVFVPVGGGGLFTAVCRGFACAGPLPRVHAVQPEGCLTVVASWRSGTNQITPVTSRTRVSGLAVPFDIDASTALGYLRSSGGAGIAVTDEEVFAAQRLMLEREGIYAEPAGAAALAGLGHAVRDGIVASGESVVCLVTGHGFKDPDSVRAAAARVPSPGVEAADLGAVLEIELLENNGGGN